MKKLNKPVVIIEGLLIVLMSTLAAYSLFGSNIRSLLLTVGLVLVGVLTIVWKNFFRRRIINHAPLSFQA